MMVNMNGLPYGTWRNIQKAIEQFDSPVKSSGNYLLKLQEVFTPGHTRQIHVLPKLGKGSLGDAAEYQRVSDKYCWEIIVADGSSCECLFLFHRTSVQGLCRHAWLERTTS